jgi:hypothetical protein
VGFTGSMITLEALSITEEGIKDLVTILVRPKLSKHCRLYQMWAHGRALYRLMAHQLPAMSPTPI